MISASEILGLTSGYGHGQVGDHCCKGVKNRSHRQHKCIDHLRLVHDVHGPLDLGHLGQVSVAGGEMFDNCLHQLIAFVLCRKHDILKLLHQLQEGNTRKYEDSGKATAQHFLCLNLPSIRNVLSEGEGESLEPMNWGRPLKGDSIRGCQSQFIFEKKLKWRTANLLRLEKSAAPGNVFCHRDRKGNKKEIIGFIVGCARYSQRRSPYSAETECKETSMTQ